MESPIIDPSTHHGDLLIEKNRVFCGSAKVWISQLAHEDLLTNPRQLDPKNVSRLRNVYLLEGCHRLEPEHHVPALIDEATLERALRNSDISRASLKSLAEPKLLALESDITYLQGRHRLEAAKEFLKADDKWWIVDLYLEALSEQGRRAIRDEYSNALNFSDGDIFRHLRYCILQGKPAGKWLSKLSDSKRRDLKQLEKLAEKDTHMKKFRDCLDALIPYTGLWSAMKIGTFHRLLPLRCPEELTQYLNQVKATWDQILGDDKELCLQLDSYTVQSLEGRCPRYSAEDLLLVESRLRRREIFSSPSFDRHRSDILRRLRGVRYLVPSIHTFLEDTKYLEPCAKVMKELLHNKFKGSIRQAFDRQHNGQCRYAEQMDENSSVDRIMDSGYKARWMAYRQLWLFAWRHFPEMTGQAVRKDARKPKPAKHSIEYTWWNAMSSLATKSGYTNIRNAFEDADESMAREFLRHARPPQLYQFDDSVFDLNVRRICDALKLVRPCSIAADPPNLSSNHNACGTDLSSRCGRPYEQAFQDDVCHLYLRYMYDDFATTGRKRYVTSFGVKRHIFQCFFGLPHDDSTQLPGDCPLDEGVEEDDALGTSIMRPSVATNGASASAPGAEPIQSPRHDAADPSQILPAHIYTAEEGTVQSWLAVLQLCREHPTDVLNFLTPLGPLEDGRFSLQRLPKKSILEKDCHVLEKLRVNGANSEHVYMDYDGSTGCKIVHVAHMVNHPFKVSNVIVCTPITGVDKVKDLWERAQNS